MSFCIVFAFQTNQRAANSSLHIVCIYRLFEQTNMDFEERNFGLPFARLTLQKKSWLLVGLFGDDSIAQKRYKKTSEIVMNYNET